MQRGTRRCRNLQAVDDGNAVQRHWRWRSQGTLQHMSGAGGLPVNTKHLHSTYTTSSTLVQHCINVIQMFCACQLSLYTVTDLGYDSRTHIYIPVSPCRMRTSPNAGILTQLNATPLTPALAAGLPSSNLLSQPWTKIPCGIISLFETQIWYVLNPRNPYNHRVTGSKRSYLLLD